SLVTRHSSLVTRHSSLVTFPPVLFRFGSAIALVVLVSLLGTSLEKRNLELRRATSAQRFRIEALRKTHASLRARTQQLGAPARLLDDLLAERIPVRVSEQPPRKEPGVPPLLRWER
ncbi:MAG: hypothetical protein WD066_01855, partial [Planctomycetaceae bacterium]